MSETAAVPTPAAPWGERHRPSPREVGGLLLFLAIAALVLTWAKWNPYSHKLPAVARVHHLGKPVVGAGHVPAFSLSGGWSFARAYFLSVWPAIVAGVLTGAAVQTLVPRRWLLRTLGGEAAGATLRGIVAGLPTMLCTCCSAPVAVGLRRGRVGVRPALAYWLTTPLLNPAVLAFAAFALPWRWALLRGVAGAALIAAVLLVAGRRSRVDASPAALAAADIPTAGAATAGVARLDAAVAVAAGGDEPVSLRRFLAALARLSLRLLPEYAVVVVLIGAGRGALFPIGASLSSYAVLGVLLLAVTGTLLAVPTAGEIPVVAGVLAAGFSPALAAALLVTLPATSVASLTMVRKEFPRRVVVAVPVLTVGVGLATAAFVAAAGL